MPLAEERAEGLYLVRWVSERSIRIDDAEFESSLLIMPDRVWRDFPARNLADLAPAVIAEVLALTPQLVILGTGPRQVLPSPELMGAFLSRGVGLEAMDTAAAARTYNLLAMEGRSVAALLLMDRVGAD